MSDMPKFLQQNWKCLVENLTSSVNHSILDEMFSKLKLSKDEYDSIYACGGTDCDKARKLLQLVDSRGKTALKVFKDTLQDCNPGLFEHLQQTEEVDDSSSLTLEKAVFSSDHDSDDSLSSGIGCVSPTRSGTPSDEEEVRMTVGEMNEMMEELDKKGKESWLQSDMKEAKKTMSKMVQLVDLRVKQEEGELGFRIRHLNRKGAKEMLQCSCNDGTLKDKVQEPLADLAKAKHNFLKLETDADLHWTDEQGKKEDARGYDGTIKVTAKKVILADDYVLEEGLEGAFERLCDYLVKNPDELDAIIKYLNSINIQVCNISRGCIEVKVQCFNKESAVHLQEKETILILKDMFQNLVSAFLPQFGLVSLELDIKCQFSQLEDTEVTRDSEEEGTSMQIVMDEVHEADASNKCKPGVVHIAPMENSITLEEAAGAKGIYTVNLTTANDINSAASVKDGTPFEYTHTCSPKHSLVVKGAERPVILMIINEYGTSKGFISTINCRAVQTLKGKAVVYATALHVPKQDQEAADRDNVTLILPDPQGTKTEPTLDWLTYYHDRYFPNLPQDVTCIIGHADITDTAARNIKDEYYPQADLVMFTHVLPKDTEYFKGGRKVINASKIEDAMLSQVHNAKAAFSVGHRIFNHFQNKYRGDKKPREHHLFLPRPSEIFKEVTIQPDSGEGELVVLSIGRVKNVENLKGYNLAGRAIGIVRKYIEFLRWITRGISKDDWEKSLKILKANLKSGDMNPTLRPYGTQEDIRNDMKTAHLVLMPSRSEPFGLVGLEAIAAGIPVLISDKSGLADMIKELVDEKKLPRGLLNRIVETSIQDSDMDKTAEIWANKIRDTLTDTKTAFKQAKQFKDDLLKSKYWEDSEREFLQACSIIEITLEDVHKAAAKYNAAVEDVISKMTQQVDNLDRERKATAENCEQVEKEVTQHYEELISKLAQEKQEMISKVHKINRDRVGELTQEKEKLETELENSKEEKKFCEQISDRKDDTEAALRALRERLQQLEEKIETLSMQETCSSTLVGQPKVTFKQLLSEVPGGSVFPQEKGKKLGEEQIYHVLRFGQKGSEQGQFDTPTDVAVSGDKLYVADTYNDRVQVFDMTGKFCHSFPTVMPVAIGVVGQTDGTIVVNSEKEVKKFSPSGKLLHKFPLYEYCTEPCGVAVLGDGRVVVTDYGKHSILLFEADGTLVKQVGGHEEGEEQFALPFFVCVDKEDNIIVADKLNHHVQVFDKNLNYKHKFGQKGRQLQDKWGPTGVSADSRGNIVLANSGDVFTNVGGVQHGKKLQVFRPDGTWVSTISSDGDKLNSPKGVAVTEDGHVFVADYGDHCIRKYRYM